MGLTIMTRPDGSLVEVDSCDDVVVHAVDVDGRYLGVLPCEPGTRQVDGPPPAGEYWRHVDGCWAWCPPLEDLQADAQGQIDVAAGSARLRFITDVPGQQGTYLLKEQQARAYVEAGFTGPVPPFVAAEAEATGTDAGQAAVQIVATADLWAMEIAPAIEMERRRGKLAVAACTDAASVAAALAAALDALGGIGT